MDINCVKSMCEGLGTVKKFKIDSAFFGNVELEIETSRKQVLSIVSDRGIFSCYVIKQNIFKERVPVDTIINSHEKKEFCNLEEAINFLKEHIEILWKT